MPTIKQHSKILFLDVDGVLNTQSCRGQDAIHPKLLRRLAEVVLFSGAKIVLSTTWRLHVEFKQRLIDKLRTVGIDKAWVVGETQQLPFKNGIWPPAEANRAVLY